VEMSFFIDHLMITLVAWMGGLTLGSGIGYLIASLVRSLVSAIPNDRQINSLVPWRPLLLMLILVVWSPLLPARLGLGTSTAMVMVGLTISLVSLFMTMNMLLNHWFPPSLCVGLIAKARNLLILALFATLGAGLMGGGGAGFYLMEQVKFLEFSKLLQGILILGGMALIMDFILSIVEYRAGFSTPSPRML
jgi:osmoprotectant transport system permease protein